MGLDHLGLQWEVSASLSRGVLAPMLVVRDPLAQARDADGWGRGAGVGIQCGGRCSC